MRVNRAHGSWYVTGEKSEKFLDDIQAKIKELALTHAVEISSTHSAYHSEEVKDKK